MESLIIIFGYTEDKKLLNWVMEKTMRELGSLFVQK